MGPNEPLEPPRNAGRLMGIADTLAEQGYRVLLSDPFYGDTAAGKEDIMVPRFFNVEKAEKGATWMSRKIVHG